MTGKTVEFKYKSTFAILLVWLLSIAFGIYRLDHLPEPQAKTDLDYFSEGNCFDIIKVLSSDIGMRVVGTPQETKAKEYIIDYINNLKKSSKNEMEVIIQNAHGSHRFDFMGEPVIKVYSNVTNIIVRLTCDTCSKDAILLNSHFDSSIVTPGAADDAAGVAIMLELIRLFSKKEIKNSIVFLFNGAEETLQDATHAFVTQHELAPTIKAVLNLEAMGAKGKEILFQANSKALVDAYKHVPRPHASSLSNDVFGTGLILSDTDFRQFVQYGNLVGLDFAFYQNSYQYHTTMDTIENIQAGSIQHFGDNIYSILEHIVNLDKLDFEFDSNTVYYDLMGYSMVQYDKSVANVVHYVVVVISLLVCLNQSRVLNMNLIDSLKVVLGFIVSIFSSIVTTIIASLFLATINPMSWFSNEYFAVYLWGLSFAVGLTWLSLNTSDFEHYRLERKAFLAGRIGPEAPVDILVPVVTCIALIISQAYLLLPLSFRFRSADRKRIFAVTSLLSLGSVIYFTQVSPYTVQAPKRLFASYMENTTSGERGVHVSFADIGRKQPVLTAISQELGVPPTQRYGRQIDKDWSTLFPFSHFVENYYFNLTDKIPSSSVDVKPTIVSSSTINSDNTRTIKLRVDYPHFIWTVLSFQAKVKSWSLSVPPPDHIHHTIRHVGGDSFSPHWDIEFTIEGTDPLEIEVSGVERDGFRYLESNSSPHGMKWIWSDHFESASVLSRVERVAPKWTSGMYVGVVIVNHIIE
ncbi:hypothetical protein HK103_006776 [Boothiomyces macroporosus]|uniref:Peptide hydrolase n=1 Tax=Boothiomyces macroporosus TaxID=261099 RepID=A0AAD5Y4E1_9FUNG|nr:hypothetical protein HK103_006776 [Boothiomyces macroporosus]